eukprot:1039847_1
MRRTQIDILKYAQQHNLPKRLIFEDDILLANPRWINMFCEVEADLPEWGVLNLGTQEGYPTFQTRSKNQIKITNHSDSPMRYCYKMDASFGTFAISFAYHMYISSLVIWMMLMHQITFHWIVWRDGSMRSGE